MIAQFGYFFYVLTDIFSWILIIRILIELIDGLTSIRVDRRNQLVQFFFIFTDPIIKPFQQILPRAAIAIDNSVIFALVYLRIIGLIVLYITR